MVHRIVQFALQQRFLVLMLTVFLVVAGTYSFQQLPVDAYPDLSPPMVEIITQWPGHAAEEVERLVSLPIELQMNGVPHMEVMRSISLYGLSDVRLTFEESTDSYFARQVVFERLSQANVPPGVVPTLAPLFSPSGLVYRYVLESPDRTPQELKVFEDWVVERAFKSVPGVADDSGFGGTIMQYQVLLDPARLYGYHLTVPQVIQQLAANNANTGGGFYSQGGQFYYVRGLGLVKNTEDIGNIIAGSLNGVPVRIKDIGQVTMGYAPRLGEFGFQKNDDSVEGVILMRRGEQTQNVLQGVEQKTEELNHLTLPHDVKVRPFYDRSDLVRLTIDTVEENLLLGMTLVLLVLIFFLVSVRAAIIVALTIPLALLFSFMFLHARGLAANLLSIGAIDFGIVIDGTVVMMENIYRELANREGQAYKLHEVILTAARDVDRPIFYSVAIIIAGYIPIYALSGPSGKLFQPMADTMAFALLGALILTLTLVPVLASYWFQKGVHEKVNKAFEWLRSVYAGKLDWCLDRPHVTMAGATVIFGATLLLIPFIGGEFLPHLDEGALWVRATLPYTISFEEAAKFAPQIREILRSYPQVTVVGSELGRPDDGTDPTGFFNCEFYVGLHPYKDKSWRGAIRTKQALIESLQKKFEAYPGVIFNYTQPAEDAVDEALTGLKSALAVKVYGDDLAVLQDKALQIKGLLEKIPGYTSLTVVRELGQPSLLVDADREKIARYGINVADVEAVVQAAVGGQAATQVIQGEKLFDLVVRMQPQFRSSAREIGNLLVGTPTGQQIPLSQLATIKQGNGASFIYRENNSRYIGVQYSIEGRDLESAVNAGQEAVRKAVVLPQGYRMTWGGGIQRVPGGAQTVLRHRAAGPAADFPDPVCAVRQLQVPVHDRAGRGDDRAGGGAAGVETNRDAVQRLVRSGAAGADGRVGRDSGDPGVVHQQAAAGTHGNPAGHARGIAAAVAADHDDGAGGLPRTAPGGALHGNRLGHAEAVRDCHRCGADLPALSRVFRQSGALLDCGAGRRRAAGVNRMRKKGNNSLSARISHTTGMFHRKSSLAVALALAGLLLFVTAAAVAPHHHDGANTAGCQACHIARSPAVQPAPQAEVARPEFAAAGLLPAPFVSHSDPILSSEASRAPPSA